MKHSACHGLGPRNNLRGRHVKGRVGGSTSAHFDFHPFYGLPHRVAKEKFWVPIDLNLNLWYTWNGGDCSFHWAMDRLLGSSVIYYCRFIWQSLDIFKCLWFLVIMLHVHVDPATRKRADSGDINKICTRESSTSGQVQGTCALWNVLCGGVDFSCSRLNQMEILLEMHLWCNWSSDDLCSVRLRSKGLFVCKLLQGFLSFGLISEVL